MKSRVSIFIVQIVWLALLGALAAVYFYRRSLIPFNDSLGSVPLAVLWFGALGAVMISLTGIVEHAHDWDESYALWHLSRPPVGASLAVVGVLILQAGVLAIGSTPNAKRRHSSEEHPLLSGCISGGVSRRNIPRADQTAGGSRSYSC